MEEKNLLGRSDGNKSISWYCSLSIIPKNMKKPPIFWHFQGLGKWPVTKNGLGIVQNNSRWLLLHLYRERRWHLCFSSAISFMPLSVDFRSLFYLCIKFQVKIPVFFKWFKLSARSMKMFLNKVISKLKVNMNGIIRKNPVFGVSVPYFNPNIRKVHRAVAWAFSRPICQFGAP